MSDVVIVLTSVPSRDVGLLIGRALVDARLAACVSVLPAMTSIYRWKGEVQQESEHQLVIKTSRTRLDAVREQLAGLHPYQLPECLVVTVDAGDPAYLAWVVAESGDPAS